MELIPLLAAVFAFGAAAGLLRGFMDAEGLVMPRPKKTDLGNVLQLGFIGSAIVGAVAAALSYGLYGPIADVVLFQDTPPGEDPTTYPLTVGAAFGAALVGFSGAWWLNDRADKKLMQATASKAADKQNVSSATKEMITAGKADAAYDAIASE